MLQRIEGGPEPFSVEEKLIIEVSREYFWFFLENIFIRSFDGFTYPVDDKTRHKFEFSAIHREWALLMQFNPRLCLMAPRAHLKSTVLKAYAMWCMFSVEPGRLMDIMYFSFKASLAGEQVGDLLRLIRNNPYFRFWKDLKPHSEQLGHFLVSFGDGVIGDASIKGDGIMSATRGRHPQVTICDDILSDFSNPLASLELQKINRIFRQAIMSLPANPDDPLLLVGTPQSYEDILYSLSNSPDWLWLRYPAIMDEKEELVQWPEKFTFQRLKRIQRGLGQTAFEVEFQLTPIHVADQFFTRDEILSVTDHRMPAWDLDEEFIKSDLATYGGFDVGKEVHPSHVTIFLELPNGTLVQIYEKFLDHMRYPEQVATLNKLARVFKLSRGYYDATFNVMEDRGLDRVWRGKPFNRKFKADMATLFEKRVFAEGEEAGIILLNDVRQINQITVVDKQLKAATSVEGHGDAFWSIGLAVRAAEDGPSIIEIGAPTPYKGSTFQPGQSWARQLGGNTPDRSGSSGAGRRF